ncbi:MAG: hypothetical protein Q4G59_12940, partial [Planctomycetia bacterium]|nr:hypothetical protein [Planctomycetia bacterium]
TYGHGAKGEVWRFAKNMPGLLAGCFATLEKESSLILLSCHVPQCTCQDLTNLLEQACRDSDHMSKSVRFMSRQNSLLDVSGRRLPAGIQTVWSNSDCAGLFAKDR